MENDLEDENFEHLYENCDEPKHEKLVDSVLKLNKSQNLKKPSRTEPTLEISEFNLVTTSTGDTGLVQLNELAKTLKSRKSRIKISERLKSVTNKSKTLPKPLEKPQADRIRRGVAYEKTRLELDRWEATVTSNRVSTDLRFPLVQHFKIDRQERDNFTEKWRLKSKLEEELEKIEPKVEEYIIDLEQEDKTPLNMKEMLERRKEAAKLRAYQSYQEAKARRHNKIKSKKYHRLQKKAKIKKALKEFEVLQKTNPEEALKKLEEIEKARVEERFSLRHKSTGQWARNKVVRAKYDKESRQVLAQQLAISRDLTQKIKNINDSDEDNHESDGETEVIANNHSENPWNNNIESNNEYTSFLGNYRNFWLNEQQKTDEVNQDKNLIIEQVIQEENRIDENDKQKIINCVSKKKIQSSDIKNKSKKNVKKNKSISRIVKSNGISEWDVKSWTNSLNKELDMETLFERAEKKLEKKLNKIKKTICTQKKTKNSKMTLKNKSTKKIDLTMPLQKKRPIIDEELNENVSGNKDDEKLNNNLRVLSNILNENTVEKVENTNLEINPEIKIAPTLLNNSDSNMEIMQEAFEDDEIEFDFAKEKQNEIIKDKPKDLDLSLPGWGQWGGQDIKPNKRKRRRFTVKAPKKIPRRDDNKGTLIINEKAQKQIREHQVSEVPFPFKSVQDFEASIRTPIGNTFIPERAYKRMIKPSVITKIGKIIEPISKDILLNKKN